MSGQEKLSLNWPEDGFTRPDTLALCGLRSVPGMMSETENLFVGTDQLIDAFGPQVDRIGHPEGPFLYAFKDGKPAPFEARSVEPWRMEMPYYVYQFVPGIQFPVGLYVVVGIIAPAMGFPGGGVQILFYDSGARQYLSAENALELGFLTQVRS